MRLRGGMIKAKQKVAKLGIDTSHYFRALSTTVKYNKWICLCIFIFQSVQWKKEVSGYIFKNRDNRG